MEEDAIQRLEAFVAGLSNRELEILYGEELAGILNKIIEQYHEREAARDSV